MWSGVVGAVLAVVAVAALALLLVMGGSGPGTPDYGIPQLLLTLALVSGAAAAVHLAVARAATRTGGPPRSTAVLAGAVAGPLLAAAALLSGFVSVDWPVLLLVYAATFVPHGVALARR